MNLIEVIEGGDFELIKKRIAQRKISKKKFISAMVDIFFKENCINSLFGMVIMANVDMLNQRSLGFSIVGVDRFEVVDALTSRDFYAKKYNEYFEELMQCCVQNNDVEGIEYLLKKKAINYTRKEKTRVLKQTIFAYGRVEVYEFLKRKKLSIKSLVKSDFSPLMSSIRMDDLELFNYLVNEGVNVNEQGSDNMTPFLCAAFYGRVRLAKALLNEGANPHAIDARGRNAIYHACIDGNIEMIDLLLNSGVQIDKAWFKDDMVVLYNEEAFMYVKYCIARLDREKRLRAMLFTK